VRNPPATASRTQSRAARALRLALLCALALLLAYLVSPYAALWRLDRAVRDHDPAALAARVHLQAVRSEIKKKLNKDTDSTIGTLSDPFIQWLEEGIRATGSDAVDRLVTLDWVVQRLLAHADDARDGFLGEISYAFFDAPDGFRVRIGSEPENQVHLRLQLSGRHWRLSALYY
jgi:hypothetical protein